MKQNRNAMQTLRRLAAAALAAALLLAVGMPAFAEGAEALQSDTIYISSTADLVAFANNCAVDSWSVGKTVVLQDDLSLEGIEWEPVPSFSGTFQGNSHTIRGLELDGSYSPAGLFAIVEKDAVIRDLSVQGLVAPGGEKNTVGGIAGINRGTLTNCQFSGAVEGGTEVGGIAGRNEDTGVLDRCTARCIVTGKSSTGGITGQNLGSITSCTNVGAVNADYQDTTLNLDGLSADVAAYLERRIDPSAEPLSQNASADTGGIAGRSSGMILSSTNAGTVGYEHLGYNVGGIVGRTDGFVSGCINQGKVYGRKDVGGIAGQAESYLQLDLSQSTLEKLRTELDNLHTVVNGSADVMDSSSSLISSDLDALQAQMNTAISAARQLQEQGSDYMDTVADEVDRSGVLVSDTLGRMEPVLDSTEQAAQQVTDALDELKWTLSEASVELSLLSADLDHFRSATSQMGDAMDDTQRGMQLIQDGIQQLKDACDRKDEGAAQTAIAQALRGYEMLPEGSADENLQNAAQMLKIANAAFSAVSASQSMSTELKAVSAGLGLLRSAALLSGTDTSQAAAASRQITTALRNLSGLTRQMSTLAGTASSAAAAQGNTQMAEVMQTISRTFADIGADLSDLEQILTELGFDTGGLHSGADTIQAGVGKLEDAAAQLRDATDELEKGIKGMERESALVSFTVQQMSDAVGKLKDGNADAVDALGQLKELVSWLGDQDPLHMPRPDSAVQDTTDTLFDAVDGMSSRLDHLNQDLKGVSNSVSSQIRAINDQIQVVSGLLLDAVEEISDPGSKTVLEDDSEQLAGMTDGRIENCTNRGTVQADVDVGGIAGAMAVENLLDPEDDQLEENGSRLRTGYSASVVVDGCVNDGTVEAKKAASGGIVGRMDLGLVQNCEAYGDVSGADQVGGIAGTASAKLRANWAKCRLSGKNYVGGIVGEGSDSTLTSGSCTVTDCRALVDIREADQFAGAISGGQEGSFSGNLFVSDTLRGIDRLSKAGQAEPTDYATLLEQENVPTRFRKITVTFKDGNYVLGSVQLDYGDSLEEADYPELPVKEGCAARWDTAGLQDVRLDTVVEAVYTDYITTLASTNEREDGRTVFLAQGRFGDRASLTAETLELPEALHNAVECWSICIPDDGQESHTVRYLPPESGKKYKVYAKQGDSWKLLETETIGSYLAFPVSGTEAELAIVPAGSRTVWLIAAASLGTLVLVGALVLAKKKQNSGNSPEERSKETPIDGSENQ